MMAKERWKLTNEQWKKIEKFLPKPKSSKKGGRPWADNREVFEGILWILRTGVPWADLPKRYTSPSTCWPRLKLWEEQDIWLEAWRAFLSELDEKGQLDWSEAFVDGSFAPANKGVNAFGKTKGGKGTKWMVVVDGQGVPLGNHLDSVSPSEVKLLEKTLNNISVPRKGRGRPRKKPKRLIADKGYDSDPLRERLACRGIELICP